MSRKSDGACRRLLRAVLAAAVVLSAAAVPAHAQDAEKVRLTYMFSDGQMPVTLESLKALLEEHPALRSRVVLGFLTESTFDETRPEDLLGSDVLVVDMMNQQMMERYDAEHGIDMLGAVAETGAVVAVGVGLAPQEAFTERGAVVDDRAQAYWQHSGVSNQLGLMKYALALGGVTGLALPEPEVSLDFGYYYPSESGGRLFAGWEAFDAWRTAAGKTRPGAARVAVGFFKSSYYSGDMATVDAVIAEIERRGAEAIPVFGYPGGVAFERLLIGDEGRARADVALALLFRFADFESAKALERLDVSVINLVTLYGRNEREWRESSTGLSMFEGTFQVAVPELAGLVAPTVIGSRELRLDLETGVALAVNVPIASRVETAVERGLRYAELARKDNADKRVVLMYYNYPPGKANIGASYLNVEETLANVLGRLEAEGYDVGDADLSSGAVLEAITTQARNVGGYAPGELEAMLDAGNAVRVPVAEYRRWLDGLAPELRDKILADWGPAEESDLMATRAGREEKSLIVPLVRYGNVVLMPQPARGWSEDAVKLYHAKDLAPHHQYVAAYRWIDESFGADAVVHIGTHGTIEWLDGKDVGQTEADASDALLGSMPDIYIYNVDVVGEGLVARRRGLATLVDHMVPPFVKGGLYPELAALAERINDYDANLHKNPELAEAYAGEIREQVLELGIAKDLGLDLSAPGSSLDHDSVHRIQDHMIELRGQNIPYGLHAFGRAPDEQARATTVEAIVETDRSLMPADAEVLAEDMEARILRSAERELDNLARAISGRFVPVGSGGEPIRNPDSYPTGKNFYGIDPDKVPKRVAYALGVELADAMLAQHLEQHGRYPEKVSFVIWGDETMRHEGVLEAQIFHLLGTRPVWDARDKVVGVEVIPPAALGRPRIDIVISSAAEGMFNNVTLLIDEAVQKVKLLDEAGNFVRRHYLETRAALVELGYSEEQADRRAAVRIFDEPPGSYNLNVSKIAEASGSWESDTALGDDYLRKMGHGFGNGFWGEPMEDVFRLALSGTEKIVHSSSTMLYGALDNDDFYMYMGGLASAVRNLDGASPELVVTNTRDPAKPEMSTIDKFIGTEFRSRYVNPTWIEGMKKEGYAGAGHMREFVEYLWGWDATVTETIDDAMWQETFAVYVQDKHELGMQEFFESESPFAYQDITARMIETIRKDYWQTDEGTLATLVTEYVESVNRHGVGCSDNTCGNPQLLEFIAEQALEAGVPVPDVEAFVAALEQAVGARIEPLAEAAREFIERNEAALASRIVPGPEAVPDEPSVESAELEGYRLEQIRRADPREPVAETQPVSAGGKLAMLGLAVGVLGVLGLWRRRHRRPS